MFMEKFICFYIYNMFMEVELVRVVIDRYNIDRFERLSFAREISQNTINKIAKALMNKEYVSPFIKVVEKDGKYVIIDGQHRIYAVKSILERNPNFKWEAYLLVFKDTRPYNIQEIYWWENVLRIQGIENLFKALKELGLAKNIFEMFKDIVAFNRAFKTKIPIVYIIALLFWIKGYPLTMLSSRNYSRVIEALIELDKDVDLLKRVREFSKEYLEYAKTNKILRKKPVFIALGNIYINHNRSILNKIASDSRFISFINSRTWVANPRDIRAIEQYCINI